MNHYHQERQDIINILNDSDNSKLSEVQSLNQKIKKLITQLRVWIYIDSDDQVASSEIESSSRLLNYKILIIHTKDTIIIRRIRNVRELSDVEKNKCQTDILDY